MHEPQDTPALRSTPDPVAPAAPEHASKIIGAKASDRRDCASFGFISLSPLAEPYLGLLHTNSSLQKSPEPAFSRISHMGHWLEAAAV
jgi:hypothetical protein